MIGIFPKRKNHQKRRVKKLNEKQLKNYSNHIEEGDSSETT